MLICNRFGDHLAAYPDIFQYQEDRSILGINSNLKTMEERTKGVGGIVEAPKLYIFVLACIIL